MPGVSASTVDSSADRSAAVARQADEVEAARQPACFLRGHHAVGGDVAENWQIKRAGGGLHRVEQVVGVAAVEAGFAPAVKNDRQRQMPGSPVPLSARRPGRRRVFRWLSRPVWRVPPDGSPGRSAGAAAREPNIYRKPERRKYFSCNQ